MNGSTQYQQLNNKVIFITGAASGIGAAMVTAFLQQHAKVAFIDIDKQAATNLIKQQPTEHRHAIWFKATDVTNTTALQLALNEAAEHFGGLNVLINNVADDSRHAVEDISVQQWQQCMQVNLDPAFFASQAAFKIMKQHQSGSIINFSSINALLGAKEMTGYVTAKAGLIGMTRALATEFGPHGIRVNAILPGWVATEKQLSSWLTAQEEAKWTAEMSLKRRITPADVAALALFLASDNSELITGQCINIDGGRA
ncbi:SDR family NAD(P)-dependent oxidoreductase [Shewanella youngdeokensis]|uniref:SDR family NAD(P)-dependent oxidoreductase n=1 Tax=Shewanella youngdeokensis TaxID=2999068 RepID=A0ABZ0JZM1_9GAMM|nr:SDR family NAD(P)-dependent oxidoreductase [Shewanella sp. DAU334]